jgi:hypothetical protein
MRRFRKRLYKKGNKIKGYKATDSASTIWKAGGEDK